MKITKYLSAVLFVGMLSACGDDYLEPVYSGAATTDELEATAKDNPEKVLNAQLDGVYASLHFRSATSSGNITDHQSVGLIGIMMLSNNMSNDVSLYMANDPWHFDKQLDYYSEQYVRSGWPWGLFYTIIKAANDVIGLVDPEKTTTEGRALYAQALTLRAFSYFNLAQFYQDTYVTSKKKLCVPLCLSDKEVTIPYRATVEQVYNQIEKDLTTAVEYLEGYERTSISQIDQSVAQAILSRVYLVMHKWTAAAELARAARTNYPLMTPSVAYNYNYLDVQSSEVMWGVDITSETRLWYASFQSWMCADGDGYGGGVGAFQLIDAKLYETIPDNSIHKLMFVPPGQSVDAGSHVIPEYANLKFKTTEESKEWFGDLIYMRSAEMYLTEAEALVRLGRADEAYNVLVQYMSNRLYDHDGDGQNIWGETTATIELVQNLRRVELWGEGHSYFDHRRWQFNMDRGYEGSNENRTAWPVHPGYKNGFVPWYHYSWRLQLPIREMNDNNDLTPEMQNKVGEEGNQDPVKDLITDWSEK